MMGRLLFGIVVPMRSCKTWKWAGGCVYCLAMSEENRVLFVGGEARFISLYDFTGRPSQFNESVLDRESLALAFDDHTSRLIAGGGDGHVTLWDYKRDAVINRWRCKARVSAVAISTQLSAVAFGTEEGTIYLARM